MREICVRITKFVAKKSLIKSNFSNSNGFPFTFYPRRDFTFFCRKIDIETKSLWGNKIYDKQQVAKMKFKTFFILQIVSRWIENIEKMCAEKMLARDLVESIIKMNSEKMENFQFTKFTFEKMMSKVFIWTAWEFYRWNFYGNTPEINKNLFFLSKNS